MGVARVPSRRGLLKGAIIGGLSAMAGTSGLIAYRTLLREGPATVEEGFIYLGYKDLWYGDLSGQPVLVSHFDQLEGRGYGYGAGALWRALVDSRGRLVPGSGLSALLIRFDPDRIIVPMGLDQGVTQQGFVAFFNVCTHLCCNVSLALAKTTMEQPSTWDDVRLHPDQTHTLPLVAPEVGILYCPCHIAQFDPFRLVWEPDTSGNTHYEGGPRYVGANWVWGPAQRALPAIPVGVQGDRLVGLNTHPEWYRGYCGQE